MTRARLFLSGIDAEGRHGARPGEQDTPQPFVVDLDLVVDVSEDSIGGTTDYRGVTELVRSIVRTESFNLIEALAERVATELLSFEHVVRATAVVHKPAAAQRLGVQGVAAAVTVGEAGAEP